MKQARQQHQVKRDQSKGDTDPFIMASTKRSTTAIPHKRPRSPDTVALNQHCNSQVEGVEPEKVSPKTAPPIATVPLGDGCRQKGSGRAKRRKSVAPAALTAVEIQEDRPTAVAVSAAAPVAVGVTSTTAGDGTAATPASNEGIGGHAVDDEDSAIEAELASLKALAVRTRGLFEWVDGPIVTAMRNGEMILLDELSLAEDAVLERLNSVLEPGRSITLAEKGGEGALGGQGAAETVVAEPGFRCVFHRSGVP